MVAALLYVYSKVILEALRCLVVVEFVQGIFLVEKDTSDWYLIEFLLNNGHLG